MAVTRNNIARGVGGITVTNLADNRLLYFSPIAGASLNKTVSTGEDITGVNSTGTGVILEKGAVTETYEFVIRTPKQDRSSNELLLGQSYSLTGSAQIPWGEVVTPSGGAATLSGGTPVASSIRATFMNGSNLAIITSGSPTAGQVRDNGDGTLTFNSADNGKSIVVRYAITMSNLNVQGGTSASAISNVGVQFHQVTGTSDQANRKGCDIWWLPKCSVSGQGTIDFSLDVSEREITLTALIPDSPAGWLTPYQVFRDVEINNANAG